VPTEGATSSIQAQVNVTSRAGAARSGIITLIQSARGESASGRERQLPWQLPARPIRTRTTSVSCLLASLTRGLVSQVVKFVMLCSTRLAFMLLTGCPMRLREAAA